MSIVQPASEPSSECGLDFLLQSDGPLRTPASPHRHRADLSGGQFPLWIIAEPMDFSDVSKLYSGLPSADQFKIAERLEISPPERRKKLSGRQKACQPLHTIAIDI
ncbi:MULTISPECIES: Abi family protein [Corynebacterium]|nr:MULTISPECIES: Abi family protein [Corynebacterium]MCZ2116097.1 Abi family protein [Corynebacterium lipophilum]